MRGAEAGARLASHHFPGAPAAVPAGPPRCSDQWEAALAGMPKYGHPGDEVTQAGWRLHHLLGAGSGGWEIGQGGAADSGREGLELLEIIH